jgi:hypothetical protein
MKRRPALLACVMLSAASLANPAGAAPAEQAAGETVDRQTQAALSMDSHPDRDFLLAQPLPGG